jgi:hypothetical protein
MSEDTLLRGVKGWLAVLVSVLVAVVPVTSAVSLLQQIQLTVAQYPFVEETAEWGQYKSLSWCVVALISAISFAAGYRLWKVHFADSVRFAIVALWGIGPVRAIAEASVTGYVYGAQSIGEIVPFLIRSLFGALLAAALWTAYLRKSRRVRNTYVEPIRAGVTV